MPTCMFGVYRFTFFHSLLMVFRILCGEWIEPLWDCMRVIHPLGCVSFFFGTLILGNFMVSHYIVSTLILGNFMVSHYIVSTLILGNFMVSHYIVSSLLADLYTLYDIMTHSMI